MKDAKDWNAGDADGFANADFYGFFDIKNLRGFAFFYWLRFFSGEGWNADQPNGGHVRRISVD